MVVEGGGGVDFVFKYLCFTYVDFIILVYILYMVYVFKILDIILNIYEVIIDICVFIFK